MQRKLITVVKSFVVLANGAKLSMRSLRLNIDKKQKQ